MFSCLSYRVGLYELWDFTKTEMDPQWKKAPVDICYNLQQNLLLTSNELETIGSIKAKCNFAPGKKKRLKKR